MKVKNLIHFATGEQSPNNQLGSYTGPVWPCSPSGLGPKIGSWSPFACEQWWICNPVKITDETSENGCWAVTFYRGSTIPGEWCEQCYKMWLNYERSE